MSNAEWNPTHRHYKGGLYRVIDVARHTETDERLVFYEDETRQLWARPAAMFTETLPDGRKRFEPIRVKPPSPSPP